jgi:hypothetical protein
LEKAWAKVKGNYMSVQGGLNAESFYALSNAPVFSYNTSLKNSSTIL